MCADRRRRCTSVEGPGRIVWSSYASCEGPCSSSREGAVSREVDPMDVTTPIEWQPAIDSATRSRAVQAAQGYCAFDVLLAGGQLVDFITGGIPAAPFGIVRPMIAICQSPGPRTDAPPP